jgi:alpha-L-fucosidase 2
MSLYTLPDRLTHIDYPAFLSQHDVIYQGPAVEGIDGLPVGNGDLGAMVWTPANRLQFNINKIDLFDDGPDGPFVSWGNEDNETQTMPRHAGALSFSHGLPSFDSLYLTGFEGRLRLAQAQVEWRAQTPFSRVFAETFVSQSAGTLVVHYQDETEEALPRLIELSRWGSRSLIHWYSVIKREVPLSLLATQSGTDGVHLWITQQLRGMHFCIAARLVGPAAPRLLHQRAGAFESEPMRSFEATIYVAVVNSEEAPDPQAAAIQKVDNAANRGLDALKQDHYHTWQRFWEASFVDLPPEQDYIENLWYLNSYHTGSCCRGSYPPNHIHALWAWNRDVFPWCDYYHWNDQLHVYPLHSTGHPELALPYFRYRRAMLEHAIEDARRVHHCGGAFYTDVANRKGYQDTTPGTNENLTPGPQIAAQFWQHFQYTLDADFLRDTAFPVIREVTQFYLDKLILREDGRYSFYATQPYEGVLLLKDTLTDLAHARQVFRIFLEAQQVLKQDSEMVIRCQEALAKLADFETMPVSTKYWVPQPPPEAPNWNDDAVPVVFKELKPGDPSMPIWVVGYKVPGSLSVHGEEVPNGAPIHEGCRDPLKHLWIFTSTNIAPVFPANQVGLDQAGKPDFDIARNVVDAFGHDTQTFSLYIIARARLGMAEELQKSLSEWPQRFQIFPQGFYHYFGIRHPQVAEASGRETKRVRVAGSPDEFIYWPQATANHMSLEGGPVLQLAVNEMLLQSYSGTLRVFPAVTEDWEGRFRLHASGGFIVSAARSDGAVTDIVIESKAGKPCRIANPFGSETVKLYQWDGVNALWSYRKQLSGKILDFETGAETAFLLIPDSKPLEAIVSALIGGQENQHCKTLGKARLGIPKGF